MESTVTVCGAQVTGSYSQIAKGGIGQNCQSALCFRFVDLETNQPTNKRVRLWLVRRAQEEARHCPCRQNSADRGSLRCASRPRVKRDAVRGRRDYFMQKSRLCQKTREEKRSRKGRRYCNAKPQCAGPQDRRHQGAAREREPKRKLGQIKHRSCKLARQQSSME